MVLKPLRDLLEMGTFYEKQAAECRGEAEGDLDLRAFPRHRDSH